VLRTPAQYADTDSGHPLRSDLDRLGLGPVPLMTLPLGAVLVVGG
jgi:hypothetical protein